ncbi:hypothetical protein MXB_2560 [Myxobolus squamalis]|nr:hypothetical protein MXB_2560 [Myxobolus squamalis]
MVAIQIIDQEFVKSLIVIWSNEKESPIYAVFPELTVVTDIKQIISQGGKIYLVLKINKNKWCLFGSFDDTGLFIRLLCNLFISKEANVCPLYMPTNIHGVLYARVHLSKLDSHMLISLNGGNKWLPMQLDPPFLECSNHKCTFDLQLPCESEKNDHMSPMQWLDTKYGHISINKRRIKTHFFTHTAGTRWKTVTHSSSEALFLNHGGIIFGANTNMKHFFFSFDEGNSWFFTRANIGKIQIVSSTLNNFFNATFITVTSIRERQEHLLDFITINLIGNFCLIKAKTCNNSDYINWSLDRNQYGCINGQELVHFRKTPGLLCVDKSPQDKFTIKSNCTCTISDYRW